MWLITRYNLRIKKVIVIKETYHGLNYLFFYALP